MLRRVPRNDPLVAACAAQQQDLIEQLAGGITSATTWSDRVARITFLAVALDEMRHNLLDLQAAEPRRAAAAADAIAGLAADRAATAHLLTDFTAGARAAGWDGTDPVRAAADAQGLAQVEEERANVEERKFRDTRKDALRSLIGASLVAALLVAILLVTALDLARTAERALAQSPAPEDVE